MVLLIAFAAWDHLTLNCTQNLYADIPLFEIYHLVFRHYFCVIHNEGLPWTYSLPFLLLNSYNSHYCLVYLYELFSH